jgi:ABC-type Zn uptake system ZnuABC Zn-binding protein ZnuA
MSIRIALTGLLLAVTIPACGGSDDDPAPSGGAPAKSGPERPLVVATTTQLGDIAREVSGRDATIHQLLQANSDPHEYEPRSADVQATAGAKLVIESGNELDHWMGQIVKRRVGIQSKSPSPPVTCRTGSRASQKRAKHTRPPSLIRTGGTTLATSSRRSA